MATGVKLSELNSLSRGQVHLWHLFTGDAKRQGWLVRYDHLLTSEERTRHEKFVFEKDRDQFLIAKLSYERLFRATQT